MQIRLARADDAPALAGLYLQSAEHHAALDPVFYRVPDRAIVGDHYANVLGRTDQPANAIFVADLGGTVASMIEVQIGAQPSLSSMVAQRRPAMISMVVDENHRSAGIGSELLHTAERWAHEQGAELVMLDMLANNEGARSLYERLGYETHGLLLLKWRPNPEEHA